MHCFVVGLGTDYVNRMHCVRWKTECIGSCKSYKMNGMEPSDMIQVQTKNATGTISASPKTYNKAMHSVTSTPGLSNLHRAP